MLVLELLPCILFISTIGYILNDEESLLILHWCGIYMDSTTNVNKPISSSKKFVLQLWTCSACLWNFSMFIHYRIRLQAFFFFLQTWENSPNHKFFGEAWEIIHYEFSRKTWETFPSHDCWDKTLKKNTLSYLNLATNGFFECALKDMTKFRNTENVWNIGLQLKFSRHKMHIQTKTTRRRVVQNQERQSCFLGRKVQISKVVYDQKHHAGSSFSQGIHIRSYIWLRDHQKMHGRIV